LLFSSSIPDCLLSTCPRKLDHYIGRLLGTLKEKNFLTPDIEQSLQDALKQRNYVAHNFFKDKLPTLYSEKGQDEAIFILRGAGGIMKHAIDQFAPLVEEEYVRYGYDADYVEEYAKKAIKDAIAGR
jgi:hypothetical protein